MQNQLRSRYDSVKSLLETVTYYKKLISMVAMHLVVAHLLSMSVTFCLLPTSNMCCDFKQQQWFRYSVNIVYFIDLYEQQMWELRRQFCLTLPLQGTPRNNHIKIILPETRVPGPYFCLWQYMYSSANFRTVFVWNPEHANPWRPWHADPKTEFKPNGNSKSSKDISFSITEKPLRGYILQYNNCGFVRESLEDTTSEISENCHFWGPYSHLSPSLQ